MAVNVKLLRKVRKMIAEEPLRLRMGHWAIRLTKKELSLQKAYEDLPPCGTTACLAGHIILAAHPKKKWSQLFDKEGLLRLGEQFRKRGGSMKNMASVTAAKLVGLKEAECPFGQTEWQAPEVLAWIDEQIAKAK